MLSVSDMIFMTSCLFCNDKPQLIYKNKMKHKQGNELNHNTGYNGQRWTEFERYAWLDNVYASLTWYCDINGQMHGVQG